MSYDQWVVPQQICFLAIIYLDGRIIYTNFIKLLNCFNANCALMMHCMHCRLQFNSEFKINLRSRIQDAKDKFSVKKANKCRIQIIHSLITGSLLWHSIILIRLRNLSRTFVCEWVKQMSWNPLENVMEFINIGHGIY
jgi:hypothetical protein